LPNRISWLGSTCRWRVSQRRCKHPLRSLLLMAVRICVACLTLPMPDRQGNRGERGKQLWNLWRVGPFEIRFCPFVEEHVLIDLLAKRTGVGRGLVLPFYSLLPPRHRAFRWPLLRRVLIRISASPNHGLRMARPSGQWDCLLAENLIC